MDRMPARVWLRKCGGGFTLPGGKTYLTVTGDDRELPRHVEYVRADAAADLLAALKVIRQLWAGHSEACAAVTSSNRNKCDCDWPKIAAQCDAAITKAQGQEVAPDGRGSSVNGDEG